MNRRPPIPSVPTAGQPSSPGSGPVSSPLDRFLLAQRDTYPVALAEIRAGRKRSHWMWFIFPQLAGLGMSEMSRYYGIRDRQEAVDYLDHPVLGRRLIEISTAIVDLEGVTATDILGTPDDLKLQSCSTLFASISPGKSVFEAVLQRYFAGQPDQKTLDQLA
jgi:uncharacterized protein (DUF1810 family)